MLGTLPKAQRVVVLFLKEKYDYYCEYQYGTPGASYGWTLVQVDDLNPVTSNTRWSTQPIYNRKGFPLHLHTPSLEIE
jgi:hypothetical protein